jgi:uncharacterized membrane protein
MGSLGDDNLVAERVLTMHPVLVPVLIALVILALLLYLVDLLFTNARINRIAKLLILALGIVYMFDLLQRLPFSGI